MNRQDWREEEQRARTYAAIDAEKVCDGCGGSRSRMAGCLACCRDCGFPCGFEKDGEAFHADPDDDGSDDADDEEEDEDEEEDDDQGQHLRALEDADELRDALSAVYPYALSRAEDLDEQADACARESCSDDCAENRTCHLAALEAAAAVERARVALGLPK